MTDVLVAGAGPAAWAAAAACARLGLDTLVVAPDPRARWPATYGMWADECAALPAGSRWLEASTRVIATSEHHLARRYAVLDNDSVRAALEPGVRTMTGAAVEVHSGPRGSSVTLSSGRVLAAAVVIDATGARRALSGGPVRGGRVEQSAFGVVVDAEQAAALVAPGEALFMDWRAAPGFDASTFLYAVPVLGGRVLLEETSLARRPGLGLAALRARLWARLREHGVLAGGPTERVGFPPDPTASPAGSGPTERVFPPRLPAAGGRAGGAGFGPTDHPDSPPDLPAAGGRTSEAGLEPTDHPDSPPGLPAAGGRTSEAGLEPTDHPDSPPDLPAAGSRAGGAGFGPTKHPDFPPGVPVAGGRTGAAGFGPTERVRFALDLPVTAGRAGVVAFGVAAGLVHPATGYSVAESFRLAPRLAEAIAGGLERGPGPAVRAGRRAVWPAAARAVYLLRRRGLAVLLGLPPARLPEFFEVFFRMPPDLQQRFLAGHADLSGTTAAMVGIFRAADRALQTDIARHWAKPVNLATFSVNSW